MFQDFLDRLLVLLRTFLHNAAFERAAQIEHRTIIQGFAADQDALLNDLARDHIQRPSDVAVDHMAFAVGRGDRTARGAEIDADTKGFVAFFHDLIAFPLGDAEIARVIFDALEQGQGDIFAIMFFCQ